MKKVLEENAGKPLKDKGIVVYVAPTKALVQQVAAGLFVLSFICVRWVCAWFVHECNAEVYKRYSMVYGVLTTDYKIRPDVCEVLVVCLFAFVFSFALFPVCTPYLPIAMFFSPFDWVVSVC